MALSDENLQVGNPKIVDFEWKSLYSISSKQLNKIYLHRFLITLTLLTRGDFKKGGPIEDTEWSSKRDNLKIKRVEFECDYQELTHLLFRIKNATNSLEKMFKKAK